MSTSQLCARYVHHQDFAAIGNAKLLEDPTSKQLADLRSSIDKVCQDHPEIQRSLLPDWSNFMDFEQLRSLIMEPGVHELMRTPASLKQHCADHVRALLEARGKLDLHSCVAKAKEVELKACFWKQDLEVFTFLAEVYGTDVHVVSAPDDSIIAFLAGKSTLKIYDGPGLWSKLLAHAHIVLLSGASKSPMLVFYVNDVLKQKCSPSTTVQAPGQVAPPGGVAGTRPSAAACAAASNAQAPPAEAPAAAVAPHQPRQLQDALPESMRRVESWLVTTEINYGGVLRKCKETGGLLIVEEEIDTLVSEANTWIR